MLVRFQACMFAHMQAYSTQCGTAPLIDSVRLCVYTL